MSTLRLVGWLLGFYYLATYVLSGHLPMCDSAQSWRLHSAAPLGNQAVSTHDLISHWSYYPNTEPTSPCSILIIARTWLGSGKYQFCKSLVWLNEGSNPRSHVREARALPIRPPRPTCTIISPARVSAAIASFRKLFINPGNAWASTHSHAWVQRLL